MHLHILTLIIIPNLTLTLTKSSSQTGITSAGFELECSIPSGPYPKGSQILLQTPFWEIHPDTPTSTCDCESPTRCINLEFATIGGLSKKRFKESIKDAGYLFGNFNIYGFDQKFEKGQDFRFMSKTSQSLIRERESLYYGSDGFVQVLNGFGTSDTEHMRPRENGTFGCKPQVTVSLFKDFSFEFLLRSLKISEAIKNKMFLKIFYGNFVSNLEKNYYLNFLNQFMIDTKDVNVFANGEESAKSLAFFICYYFIMLFDVRNFRRDGLELKYSLTIMSRIAFSDMYDALSQTSKNQTCTFILNLCSTMESSKIHESIEKNTQCNLITPETLEKCENFKLINYINEESNKIHPENEDDRLTFSKWLLSIVHEKFRLPLIKLIEEPDSEILPKTDLLSPPKGLRIMGKDEIEANNEYRYGMGKYFLDDKNVVLVELRSLNRIMDLGNHFENYMIEMNKTFRFLYGEGEPDIWEGDRDRPQENVEIVDFLADFII